jgi:hypothetical protein
MFQAGKDKYPSGALLRQRQDWIQEFNKHILGISCVLRPGDAEAIKDNGEEK